MTVSNQATSVTLATDGSQTTFDFGFEIPYQSDGSTPAVKVYSTIAGINTPLVLNTDYTITGVGPDFPTGGSITTIGGSSPLAAGTVTIQRDLDYVQPSAFPNQGFLPENVETALDFMMFGLQQIASALSDLQFYTVGTLPTGALGQRAFVTDATAPTFLGTLTGSGTITSPVFFNGLHWVAG